MTTPRDLREHVQKLIEDEFAKPKKAQRPDVLARMICMRMEDGIKQRILQHFSAVVDGDIASERHSHYLD